MYPLQLLSIQVVLLLLLSLSVVLTDRTSLNFVVTGDLTDGEHEVLFKFGDLVARETSATSDSTPAGTVTLLLRQVSLGTNLLQLVYKIRKKDTSRPRMHLISCEQVQDRHLTLDFRRKFSRQLVKLHLNLNAGNTSLLGPAGDHIVSQVMLDDAIEEDDFQVRHSSTVDLNSRLDDIRNVSVQILDHVQVPSEYKHLLNFSHLERQCERVQQRQETLVQQRLEEAAARNETNAAHSRRRRETFPMGILPGTLWCGMDTVATRQSSIGAHVGTDVCCRQHDHCPVIIGSMTSHLGLFNYRMYTISHCSCDESLGRWKREIYGKDVTSIFRVPGTKWCGVGYSAKEGKELGGLAGVDKCCRFHDLKCPFYIEGFQEKYGLRNWRMYTMMECSCDERFRSCLKQTNTGAADFVGKLFFNIIQTKCFILKKEPTCTKTTWWGKCQKYESKKQAHLRDPLPY